jgi:large subunit ribosomal protein L10
MSDTEATDTGRPPRPEKVAIVDEVRARLEGSSAALLTEYRGLKVSELATLRTALTSAGGDLKIYKNTLVRFAVRDLGIELDEAMLVGPTAIAFVDGDAAAVAKALRDYARTNPALIVKGGVLGSSALSATEARALADLPSREVLLARLAGGLAAPLAGFAGLLQALPRNLAYGLKALIEKGGAPAGQARAAGSPEESAPAAAPADDGPATEAADEPVADAPAEGAPASEVPPAADEPRADVPAEGAPASEVPPAADELLADARAGGAPATDLASDAGGGAGSLTEDVLDAPVGGASPAALAEEVPPAGAPATDEPAEGAPPIETSDAAPAAELETTGAAPAAEADTEGEAAAAETTDTPEEAS